MPSNYIPSHFVTSDTEARKIATAHPFATLMTVLCGPVYATQIPFIFRGENTLIAHMARANPHSAALLAETTPIQATIQFTGVNGYIPPAWYVVNTGVPTWNYQSVQVRGRLSLLQGSSATEGVVKALIDAFDGQAELVKQAWADSPAAAQAAQLGAILAFEIAIDQLEGKSKLSQNRPLSDRYRVIAELEQGSQKDRAMAEAVRAALPSE